MASGTTRHEKLLGSAIGHKVRITLDNGNVISGILKLADQYTVTIQIGESLHIIYKHAIVGIEIPMEVMENLPIL